MCHPHLKKKLWTYFYSLAMYDSVFIHIGLGLEGVERSWKPGDRCVTSVAKGKERREENMQQAKATGQRSAGIA
jgi:hypothetical protein